MWTQYGHEITHPELIQAMPTQLSLETRLDFRPNTKSLQSEEITKEYVALMQNPNLLQEPDYINETTRDKYCFLYSYCTGYDRTVLK